MNDEPQHPERSTTRRRVLGAAALTPVLALAAPAAARAEDENAVERAARPDAPECLADLVGEI